MRTLKLASDNKEAVKSASQAVYEVWRVYEKTPLSKFYVVNPSTREIQSCWDTLLEAREVARRLTRR